MAVTVTTKMEAAGSIYGRMGIMVGTGAHTHSSCLSALHRLLLPSRHPHHHHHPFAAIRAQTTMMVDPGRESGTLTTTTQAGPTGTAREAHTSQSVRRLLHHRSLHHLHRKLLRHLQLSPVYHPAMLTKMKGTGSGFLSQILGSTGSAPTMVTSTRLVRLLHLAPASGVGAGLMGVPINSIDQT
eukprot:SM000120S25684  [mRNA]  locus=s120:34037:34928:- [translate_table: standard]